MAPKIDYQEITKLIDLLEKRKLADFELEIEGFKIRITREQPGPAAQTAGLAAGPSPAMGAAPSATETEAPEQAYEENLHIVKSPMVGTFYRAPDPSAPHFVEIGDEVAASQTLCLIEAMKLMNEIEADAEGVIEEVFVKNGQPVEYGQKLFSIRLK